MVTGGRPLNGSVKIPAAKNSVLPLFAASLLCTGEVRLQAVPRLADVEHKLYCRIFPKKLCDDLVWIYSCFSIIGFCLLVCKGEKQTDIYTISADFGSIVQYVLCIWMLVF